jgi:hypothetical protein
LATEAASWIRDWRLTVIQTPQYRAPSDIPL